MITSRAFGQTEGFGYGTILGIGQANVNSDGLPQNSSKISFTGGVTSCYKFNNLFGLTLDITAVSKGAKNSGTEKGGGVFSGDQKYNENFTFVDLDIPLMAKFCIGSEKININLLGGVSMNFNLLATGSRTYENSSYNDNNGYSGRQLSGINTTNLGYTAGLGITAMATPDNFYFIHLRTNGPLNEFGSIAGHKAYHQNFNITFGYLFY